MIDTNLFCLTATHTTVDSFQLQKLENKCAMRTNAEQVRDVNAPLTFHVLSKCSVCERIWEVLCVSAQVTVVWNLLHKVVW